LGYRHEAGLVDVHNKERNHIQTKEV